MRELAIQEIDAVSGGISGYEGAGAVLTVLGTGAAIAAAPISAVVITVAIGVAAGLAIAQFWADVTPPTGGGPVGQKGEGAPILQ